tara:strand:- start:291 stop:467 length:177 start_codon:yes stop_codon:yes gene_type:complete
MPKKRKLNSKNPIYNKADDNAPKIKKKVLMCKAAIRNASGQKTGRTADVHGIWYEDDE